MSEEQPLILGTRPDDAEAPLVVGLPGDTADQRSAVSFLSEREQVVGERPFPGELPGLALGGDLPGEGLVVPDAQVDRRVAGRVCGPVSGQIPGLAGVVAGGGAVAARRGLPVPLPAARTA